MCIYRSISSVLSFKKRFNGPRRDRPEKEHLERTSANTMAITEAPTVVQALYPALEGAMPIVVVTKVHTGL